MKKYSIYLIAAAVMVGCGPSLTEKAEKLAKSEVCSLLYNPDSYEPIQTMIDSVYVSIYTDRIALQTIDDYTKIISDIEDVQQEYDSAKREYNSAKSSAAIWSDSYSAFAREEFRQAQDKIKEAQKEMDDYSSQLKELEERLQAKKDVVKQRASDIKKGEFLGWGIIHRFRCANGFGIKSISDMLIISDKNIDYVIYHFSLDEDEKYSFQNIKKIIDEILEK